MDDEESDAGDTADGETDEGDDENGGDDRSKRRERLGSRENFWGG
jgi:hypothetical protein